MTNTVESAKNIDSPLVMIVDDYHIDRMMIKKFLLQNKFQVCEAENGQDALEMLKKEQPSLILLDVSMPVMDGFETCRRIKQMQETADIPVIMVTASEDDFAVNQSFDAGANEYIFKPLHWELLKRRIVVLIDSCRLQKSLHEQKKILEEQVAIRTKELQRERDIFLLGPVITFTWKNKENWSLEQISGNVLEILGYSAKEFLNGSVAYTSCIHPDDLEQVLDEIVSNSEDNTTSFIHEPYRLINRSGKIVWALHTTNIIRDDQGAITLYLGYLVDISKQKEQEQLLLKTARQQEELKRLESLKTMAGAIAHRFNNAMMAVLGNLDLICMTLPEDSPEKNMALNALKSTQGASLVGTMMLTYVGQGIQQLGIINLPDLVRETISELKSQYRPSINLQCVPPTEPLYCKADQQQLKEVITTVLNNSVESLEESEGSVEVTFGADYFDSTSFPMLFHENRQKDGFYVFCQISDTGHGISAEDLQKIFEPFYTTRFIGRGLGLPLAAGIMCMHHGALTVESSPGKGTVVRVLLPASEHPTKKQEIVEGKKTEDVKFSGEILLADDESVILDFGKRLLEHFGFKAHTAVNGKDAVDKVRMYRSHLRAVILDISMPVMDGIEAMQEIRKINPDIPVLLISGYAMSDMPLKNGLISQPDGFLQKPFQVLELKKSLEKLLF